MGAGSSCCKGVDVVEPHAGGSVHAAIQTRTGSGFFGKLSANNVSSCYPVASQVSHSIPHWAGGRPEGHCPAYNALMYHQLQKPCMLPVLPYGSVCASRSSQLLCAMCLAEPGCS
jgi:hypothetical protein